MTSFYQPHVREPVFLATVRASLWALDGQDAAVSLASAAGSLLAVFATYLLGASLISRVGGLVAAALMAIEYESIAWAVDGWRDDLFTGTFVLNLWAILRFRERASFGNALVLGLVAGAACLTRITALSFVLPGFLWLAVAGGSRDRSAGSKDPAYSRGYLAAAVVIFAAVVAPYLISCWVATGDPFFSINYHTTYYRFAEGIRDTAPLSATAYIQQKVTEHPVAMLDVGATGLFVRPFERRWSGFSFWLPALSWFLAGAALVGLAIWIFSPRGRLMLLMLLVSLFPYAFTWNLGGGGEWRFTMHAYPVYLLAAVHACSSLWHFVRRTSEWRTTAPAVARRAAAVGLVSVLAAGVYLVLPWFVVREVITNGKAAMIGAGERDRVFFRKGWSPPRTDGNVTARTSEAARATVHFPLPHKRSYEVVLRLDPLQPDVQHQLTVLFNSQVVARLRLAWNPERVGSYRFSLPVEWVKRGGNEITLVPELIRDPAKPIGVRLWYVRVLD
jgi:4-amino-4-deoxy-L-arabinose transferase-like glycosyltransferase